MSVSVVFLFSVIACQTIMSPPPAREDIRSVVQRESLKQNLHADFVFSICEAESSLRPDADSGKARGLMQLTEIAWKQVRTDSWRNAWDWEENIEAGTAYLAWCRNYLLSKNRNLTYGHLAAAYRYGPNALIRAQFDISRLPTFKNKIYQTLIRDRRPLNHPRLG